MAGKGEGGAWHNVAAIQHLLSGAAHCRVAVPIAWEQQRSTKYVLRLPVSCDPGPWEQLSVEMTANTNRPSSPTISYFSSHGFVHRVCVNGAHQAEVATHEHRITSAGVRVHKPGYITDVPLAPPVSPGAWERVFREFLSECNIDLDAGLDWQSPWEGA